MTRCLPAFLLLSCATFTAAVDLPDPTPYLQKPIVGTRQGLLDVTEFVAARIPRMPEVKSAAEWEKLAAKLRRDTLDRAVYRGEAARWRDAECKVEWLETIPGGDGYRLRKLRYEALPGLWIPAILYEPTTLKGKVPVHLAVNGHEGLGKSVQYKQMRCINLAKRGIITLNPEWLGMGQFRQPNYSHARMNQLDVCGTSGLAPFYLSMKRGLDVLLAHEHADPQRVAVSGLSGGGWQTILISSLDTRVSLANPVAGYSSFRTRLEHHKDLGDSEQTPVDLATVVDYTHLTAMLAPRNTLLTYNAKDECCFESGYALPPLLHAAQPIFKLFQKEQALRTHVNEDPGTHNFQKDNRQAFYRSVGETFFPNDAGYLREEIPTEKEVKPNEDLIVELPKNEDFNSLALALCKHLPRDADAPRDLPALRARLRDVVKYHDWTIEATKAGEDSIRGLDATYWKLKLSGGWTIPCVELSQNKPTKTVILLADNGRKSVASEAQRLVADGYRVLALDPWYFGESAIETRGSLFALLIATVGERPLGVQASQVAAAARWAQSQDRSSPVSVVAIGPRTSLIALVAGAIDEKGISAVTLHGSMSSLKEVIEKNMTVDQRPECFCFGLLEVCDIHQMTALVAPRPLVTH